MVYVHMALPHSTCEDAEKIACIPICMIGKDGSVAAGLVLVSIGTYWQLPGNSLRHVDLFFLDDSYRKTLEE